MPVRQKVVGNPGYKLGTYFAGDIQITATDKQLSLLFPMEIDCPDKVIRFVLNGVKRHKIEMQLIDAPISGAVAHSCPTIYSNNTWDIKRHIYSAFNNYNTTIYYYNIYNTKYVRYVKLQNKTFELKHVEVVKAYRDIDVTLKFDKAKVKLEPVCSGIEDLYVRSHSGAETETLIYVSHTKINLKDQIEQYVNKNPILKADIKHPEELCSQFLIQFDRRAYADTSKMTVLVRSDKSAPPFLYIRNSSNIYFQEYFTDIFNNCMGEEYSFVSICGELYENQGLIFYPNLEKMSRKAVTLIDSHKCYVPLERYDDIAHYQNRQRYGDICSVNFKVPAELSQSFKFDQKLYKERTPKTKQLQFYQVFVKVASQPSSPHDIVWDSEFFDEYYQALCIYLVLCHNDLTTSSIIH